MNWGAIAEAIGQHTGQPFCIDKTRSVGGGCINDAWHIQGKGQEYFIKSNRRTQLAMFEAEQEGLTAMFATDTIRVPRAMLSTVSDSNAVLILEYIPLQGQGKSEEMGRRLAMMHQHTRDLFGWHRDNTIGSTTQANELNHDWVAFWRDQRLGFQLKLAADKGLDRKHVAVCEQLMARLEQLLPHQPQASLLHGDLWSGNAAYDAEGMPVIFDPACYYGDRECDLAMTELFGGFDQRFYAAYQEYWPVPEGYDLRKILYNQYHILNHYNLFGGGYAQQAGRMGARILAECG